MSWGGLGRRTVGLRWSVGRFGELEHIRALGQVLDALGELGAEVAVDALLVVVGKVLWRRGCRGLAPPRGLPAPRGRRRAELALNGPSRRACCRLRPHLPASGEATKSTEHSGQQGEERRLDLY